MRVVAARHVVCSYSLRAVGLSACQTVWPRPTVVSEAATVGELIHLARARLAAATPPQGRQNRRSQVVASKWERGRSTSQEDTVRRVADALGVAFTMCAVQEAAS